MNPSQVLIANPTAVLSVIYQKLKEKINGNVIKFQILKETVTRKIISSGNVGGDRKGVPKCYLMPIITDMEKHGMIKRLDHTKYQIMNNKYCNRVLRFPY